VFRVEADSLQAYLDFDAARKPDLVRLHALMRKAAPDLERYLHKGTPPGEPGMRFKMIGYGKYRYAARSGTLVEWPVIGVALQKNYISVYVSVTKAGASIVQTYAGKLGALPSGGNNFSFQKFDDLKAPAVSSLFAEVGRIFKADPENPVRYREGR
jgi:hypothetical protein